jgi:hypothetical protein
MDWSNISMCPIFRIIQKASDTVIHTRIKIKLLENDIGHHFFNIIKNMYSQSKSCVKLKNTLTDFFGDYVGVNNYGLQDKHVVRCPRFFCKPHLAIIDHMVFI